MTRAPHGCLMTFHRAASPAAWAALPNRDFYVEMGFLDRLLSWLAAHRWDVVTVEEGQRRVREGDPRRFVNFSIDDAYRDTFELVLPLFRRHGVPVTVFVTTGIPDGTLVMWTAGLETILLERDAVVLPEGRVEIPTPESKRALFARLVGEWEPDAPERHYERLCADNGYAAGALHERHAVSWDMLEAMSRDPHVELGGHTVLHRRISSLPEPEAFGEISNCRVRLEERLGIDIGHFAFPYGRRADCGPRDFGLVAKAGYRSASTTTKGILRGRQEDAFVLPRNTLNGSSRLSMVQAHLYGLSGIAARVLGRV